MFLGPRRMSGVSLVSIGEEKSDRSILRPPLMLVLVLSRPSDIRSSALELDEIMAFLWPRPDLRHVFPNRWPSLHNLLTLKSIKDYILWQFVCVMRRSKLTFGLCFTGALALSPLRIPPVLTKF